MRIPSASDFETVCSMPSKPCLSNEAVCFRLHMPRSTSSLVLAFEWLVDRRSPIPGGLPHRR